MQRRIFSQEFKEKLIKEAAKTGNTSMVVRKYNIHPTEALSELKKTNLT